MYTHMHIYTLFYMYGEVLFSTNFFKMPNHNDEDRLCHEFCIVKLFISSTTSQGSVMSKHSRPSLWFSLSSIKSTHGPSRRNNSSSLKPQFQRIFLCRQTQMIKYSLNFLFILKIVKAGEVTKTKMRAR